MKKIRLPFIAIVVAALLLSTTACKKPELELVWLTLNGSGVYHSADNTSTLKLSGIVEVGTPRVATKPITAEIYAWECMIWAGDVLVLYINSENKYDILGDHKLEISPEQSGSLWLDIETLTPKAGDIYNLANPDEVQLKLWIADSNDETYMTEAVGPFTFTRD